MATATSTDTGLRSRRYLPGLRELALFCAVVVLAGVLGQLVLNRGPQTAATDASVADTPPAATAVAFFGARVAANPASFVDLVRLGEAHFRQARETSDASAYERAGEAARRAIEINADYPAARLLLASSQLALHEFQAAFATALPLIESRNAGAALAIVYDAQLAHGDYPAAEASLAQLRTLSSGPSIAVRAAGLAELRGDVEPALALADRAYSEAQQLGLSGDALAWYAVNSAELYLRYGERERADGRFAEALELAPRQPAALAGLGRVALADGDAEAAVGWLTQAVAIAPQPEFLVTLADSARLAGDAATAASALAQLEAMVQLAIDGGGLSNRALALYLVDNGGDLDVALTLAEREAAVRADVYTFDTLAWVLLARGDLDGARAASEQALALGVQDPLLLYHSGRVQLALGHDSEARELLVQALEINAQFHPVHASAALELLSQRR